MLALHGALDLASLDKRASALAPLRAEIVSQSKSILFSLEAESRDSSLTWSEVKLASIRTVTSSDRAKLVLLEETVAGLRRTLTSHEGGSASHGAKVGSHGAILVFTETTFGFQALTRGVLTRDILLCLLTLMGLELPSKRSCSNLS